VSQTATWLALAFAFVSLCSSVILYMQFSRQLREKVKESASEREAEYQAAVQTARLDLARLGEQVEEMIEDARSQRHRAAGAKGGRGNKAAEGPKYASLAAYKHALERGAPRDPETERALGWQ
jgi:hypothetical protein